jgi:S-adenosylmethionine:tRNA ribosyltransferase-isomerase
MRVDLFDFELPEANIALRPASPRDSAKLLVVEPGQGLSDRTVRDLPSLLEPGDLLVFNDTKVIPAQLTGIRRRGEAIAQVDVTLHMRHSPDSWYGFARPAKKLVVGDRIQFGHDQNACFLGKLDATVLEKGEAGEVLLGFDFTGPALDDAIHSVGHIPLPPYIASKREEDERDKTDYQTIYANEKGAVAAPTAGLHFTPELFAALDNCGIERRFVTLHVGAGTFLPVKADDTADHKMHAETGVSIIRGDGALQSTQPAPRAGALSQSAPRRCACWKARQRRTARWTPGAARLTSLSSRSHSRRLTARPGAAKSRCRAARSRRLPSCRSGTGGTVKAMYMDQVRDTGADIILGNTYHLMLRPGAERVARLGGLHEFARWPWPILTDSGGFQVMSLSQLRKLTKRA